MGTDTRHNAGTFARQMGTDRQRSKSGIGRVTLCMFARTYTSLRARTANFALGADWLSEHREESATSNQVKDVMAREPIMVDCLTKSGTMSRARIKNIRSESIIIVDPEASIEQAAKVMAHHKIRRLPFVRQHECPSQRDDQIKRRGLCQTLLVWFAFSLTACTPILGYRLTSTKLNHENQLIIS